MATLGPSDLRDLALPSLWDLTELKKVQLADGSTFDEQVAAVQAGLRLLNADLLSMPHYADLLAVQDGPEVEYPVGASNGVEEASEYSAPSPKRGATTGHTLPIKPYDRALGWTMMYLRKARRIKLDADVSSAITDAKSHWQKLLLTRLFKMEGETVGSTANASVPFADGGTVDTKYIPPTSPEGEAFLNTHDHYLRVATPLTKDLVTASVKHLQEHGHQSPFDVCASKADAALWTGFAGYKAPEWPGIVYHSSATERATITEISEFYGYLETPYGICRLWLSPRVPTAYNAIFKTYGPGDARNPIRVRIDPKVGFGWQLVPGNWINAPQLMAVMYAEYGFGIGEDRTSCVLTYSAASGDYVTPTIS